MLKLAIILALFSLPVLMVLIYRQLCDWESRLKENQPTWLRQIRLFSRELRQIRYRLGKLQGDVHNWKMPLPSGRFWFILKVGLRAARMVQARKSAY